MPKDALQAVISDPRQPLAPGCVAAVFDHGEMTQFRAAGYADVKAQRPLDENSLFYAASLSKQFTALAAATLIAKGQLSLDDDIRQYLPQMPQYAVPVTVGMLMHHSGGIRDSLSLLRLAGMENAGAASKQQALDLLYAQADTAFMPGTQYSYSNGGYLLLAEVVESVAQRDFADYAREAIFAPLGMEHSYFLNDKEPEPGSFAHGYIKENNNLDVRNSFPRFSGSGGLMLSMADLARFERDIEIERKVWTPEIARIMLTPGRFSDGSPVRDGSRDMGYGGGLHIGPYKGAYRVQHGGSAEGYKHNYVRFPERHQSFALMCNRGDWSAVERMERLIDAVAGAADAADGAGQLSAATENPAVAAAEMPKAPSGIFRSDELDATYHLMPEGKRLRVTISSPLTGKAGRTLMFERQADGSYAAQSFRLHVRAPVAAGAAAPARISISRGATGEIALHPVQKDRP